MNLYLVSRIDNVCYDEFESFVVATNTPEEAKISKPRWNDAIFVRHPQDCWTDPENVLVRHIGTAHEGIEHGEVICASFNAG